MNIDRILLGSMQSGVDIRVHGRATSGDISFARTGCFGRGIKLTLHEVANGGFFLWLQKQMRVDSLALEKQSIPLPARGRLRVIDKALT